MMGFNRKYTFWFILAVIVSFPIACNLIIPVPQLWPIVADGKSWLAFWGSYSGGVATLLAVSWTINHSEKREQARLQSEKNRYLFERYSDAVSDAVSSLHFSHFLTQSNGLEEFQDQHVAIISSARRKLEMSAVTLSYELSSNSNKQDLYEKPFMDYYNIMYELFSTIINKEQVIVDKFIGFRQKQLIIKGLTELEVRINEQLQILGRLSDNEIDEQKVHELSDEMERVRANKKKHNNEIQEYLNNKGLFTEIQELIVAYRDKYLLLTKEAKSLLDHKKSSL